MYISIGSDCVIKKRLEEFYYGTKQVSHMFDWVLSDMNAVSYLLRNSECIKDENFEIITKTVEGYYVVKHKYCYFVSLHDADVRWGEDSAIYEVVQKYSRRINRLKECIKNDIITFIGIYDDYNPIHEGNMKPSVEDVMDFFRTLNDINPLNSHSLVLLTNNTNELKDLNDSHRVHIVNTDDYLDTQKETKDWYRFFLDWKGIFKRTGVPTFFPKYTHDQGVLIERS